MAGGGPVGGWHIGVLRAMAEHDMLDDIKVWSLSCIGAWIGILYNTFEGEPIDRVRQTYHWFKQVFLPDHVHRSFPSNRVFAADYRGNALDMIEFLTNIETIKNLWVPDAMLKACFSTLHMLADPAQRNEGDFNRVLHEWMSVLPATRLLAAAAYRTQSNGMTRMHYPESKFLREINFARLRELPETIYHNAHNLSKGRIEHFSNKRYPYIDATTLCACSALPYVLKPVIMDGDIWCEGAMDRPIDFDPIDDHPEVNEVWSLPLLDSEQAHQPADMTDAIGMLPMMAAASHVRTLSEAYQRTHPHIRFVEVQSSLKVNYAWTESNFEGCCEAGYAAGKAAVAKYLSELSAAPRPTEPATATW